MSEWTCGTCGTSRALEYEDGSIACENGHEVVVHSGMTVSIECREVVTET